MDGKLADTHTHTPHHTNTHTHHTWLSRNAQIVECQDFENGLEKLISQGHDSLSDEERLALERFKKTQNDDVVEILDSDAGAGVADNFAVQLLQNEKRRRVADSPYIDVKFVPATSVLAETLFSCAAYVYEDHRKSMTPYTFECVMFLKFNGTLWNSLTVQEVINSNGSDDDFRTSN